MLARRGHDRATEAEIAQTAEELLDTAGHGPGRGNAARQDQKVAGRDRAVSAAGRALPQPQPALARDDAEEDEDAGQLAQVIPLGIFDAREEAKKWW